MFDVISDDKNTNFMLYINELYYLREFNEIELKIKNVISKIKLAKNIFSSTVKEYSNTSLLYCCYISYCIFKENKSNTSLNNFYKIYTYLLLCELRTDVIYDDRNAIILGFSQHLCDKIKIVHKGRKAKIIY